MAALLGTDEWAGKISIQVAGSTGAVLHSQQLSGRQDGKSPKSVRRLPMVYAGQFRFASDAQFSGPLATSPTGGAQADTDSS
jgi:hypothetical protein